MKRGFILFFGFIIPFFVFSQKKNKDDYSIQSIQGFVLDGYTEEWNSKFYNNDSELWSFAVAVVDDKLVCAIKVKDKNLQMEALRSGMFVDIHTDGKKKNGASFVYPFPDRERMRALIQDEDRVQEISKEELLGSSRGYFIKGFSKVVDGLLSFDNEYGIQSVVKVDKEGVLHYESVIPLQLLDKKSSSLAIQLGVNTKYSALKRTSRESARPMNVRIYGAPQGRPELKNPYKEDTSAWVYGNLK